MFIPDPKTATKEKGEKKNLLSHLFVVINFTKMKINLFLKCQSKKFGPISKNYKTYYQSGGSGMFMPDPGS
jgi:hypothetical protein